MKMEFTALEDFLLQGLYLQNGDYIYRHDKEGYPLQKDIDIAGLYVITATNDHKLEVVSFVGVEEKIDLETANGYWWILKLPARVREKIGL